MPLMFRAAVLFFSLASALCACEFDPRHDAFSFSNDTVFNYDVSADGRLHMTAKAKSGRKGVPAKIRGVA